MKRKLIKLFVTAMFIPMSINTVKAQPDNDWKKVFTAFTNSTYISEDVYTIPVKHSFIEAIMQDKKISLS